MWLSVFCAIAAAADPEDADEGDDIDVPVQKTETETKKGFGLDDGPKIDDSPEEDSGMTDFVAEARQKAPPPTWFHVQPAGRKPLADNFDIQVVAFSEQYAVIQLPVLIATNRASFVVEHPNGLSVVAEIECGAHKLVQRQEFTAAGVLADSPTLAFFEVALPVTARSASIRYLVKTAEGPPPEDPKKKPAAPTPPPALQDRFARTTVFLRP